MPGCPNHGRTDQGLGLRLIGPGIGLSRECGICCLRLRDCRPALHGKCWINSGRFCAYNYNKEPPKIVEVIIKAPI